MEKVKIENNLFTGGFWIMMWLFTVGLLNLSFGQGVTALLLWPYYLGKALAFLLQ